MEEAVLTSCGQGGRSQTSTSRDSTCGKTLQKSYGSMRMQKSHCLTSPVVLELLSRLGLETLSSRANARQCTSLSEGSEDTIAASGASGQQEALSTPLGRRASIALTSAWLSPRSRQFRMGGGHQVVSQQQTRHEQQLVAELGGSKSREDDQSCEGRPTAITTLRSPLMRQHSAASPADSRSSRKLCSSCTNKKLHFMCDNARAAPPSGPAFAPTAAAKESASRAINFSDAPKQKMGSKAMKSITKRNCNIINQQYDNNCSVAVSSLATRVCPAPPETPGAKTSVKCTTTVQPLQRQLLLAIQQYILKQFAEANTPSAATPAPHTDTTSYETASHCGDFNAQHPCSGIKRVLAHSAAFDAGATIQKRIPVTANFVSEQNNDMEGSVGRTYELKQLLPLTQPLLRPTERGAAVCHSPSIKTRDVDRYVQRIRASLRADGDSPTDCVPTSSASEVERQYPNSGAASSLAARRQTGMASLTAALLRAMDRLREPHISSLRSLCTPQFGQEDQQYRSNSHSYSEESSNSTNSSFSNTSDSGSSNSGTNNSHVAGDTAKRRKATTAAQCRSDALDISTTISKGMIGRSDAVSTRDTLLLLYVRLLKALLRDVACTGHRNALKPGAVRQGLLENASPFPWKDHELNAAPSKLCFRKEAAVQHEEGSLLDAVTSSPTEQKNFQASAPDQQRLLSISHRKRQGQHRATGLSEPPQTGKAQSREIVEGAVSPNYDCLSQRLAEAAATTEVQVEQECAAPEKELTLAEKLQSTAKTAASACPEVRRAKNGPHDSEQMRLKEPCAPETGSATHDQDVLQLLLKAHEYLRRLRHSAPTVPCEKTGKTEGACAPPGRQGGQDSAAVCGNHPKRRQERCDQTASDPDTSGAVQAKEGRDSSALQHSVNSPSEAQERQSLPRSRPLNPNAAPFVPRLALASSINVGLPPSLTCGNAFTSTDHPQQFTASFSSSLAAAHAASGCPEVWNVHDLPLREQPLQQARSLCIPGGSSPVAPTAVSGGQSQDHQAGGTLRRTQLRNIDCEKHEHQSTINGEQASFERYLQRLLQHYVQHQSLERVSDKLSSVRGDSTVTPTGTPAHPWDGEVSSTSRVPPSAKSVQYASWVKEREMLCHLEQRRTQGLPKTGEVPARVAAARAPLCTRDADESQQDAQGRPLDESSRGLHPERTFLKSTQNVGLPPSRGSGMVQKSLEPSAALQQLLLYFRREQNPEYLVASKVLQQLAASMRHPHSSPLPPALKMFSQLRSASDSKPHAPAHAAATSCAGSKKDDCLEVQGKARTALATARTLLQASAREEVVYRATGNFNKQAVADTRPSDKVKTSTKTSVFSLGTSEIPHRTHVGFRLNDGRVEGLLESAVLQQLQSSEHQQQLQEYQLQGPQRQAFGLKKQNSNSSSRLPYQAALQAALANLLHSSAEPRSAEGRPNQVRVPEPNALKMAVRTPHLEILLQQLKRIHGLAKAQSPQRTCNQEEGEQAPHSDLPRDSDLCTTDAVGGTSGHFATTPPAQSTVSKETAENSESEEGFSKGSSTRIYTKLELLQSFYRMRKREQLSYGQGSGGLSQRMPCEDNLFFKMMPVSRSQIDSGHPHRTLHHQHPTRQHQQEETEQQQPAATNVESHETSTHTTGQGGVHTLTETRACIKSVLPAAKPFQHNLAPSAVVDRPSPPNILRYFLSPKNGSEHSSTSTGDSTLTDSAVACEVSSTKSSLLKSAERTSSRVAFPAPRAEAPRVFSQECWSQFARTECCVSRLPTPQSSDSGPKSSSAGAAEERSNVEADCFPSPASATCGSSRPLSVSSTHLALQRPTERNGEIQQPNRQKEGRGGSGSCHSGPCESDSAGQPCEQKEPPLPVMNKPPGTSAAVWMPPAGGGAVPTSASDGAAVEGGNKQQNSLFGAPSSPEHDRKELTHQATSSTTAPTSGSRTGGDASRISNEPYGKQKPLASQHSSSASMGTAIGTPEQRSSNEDVVQQDRLVGKQQHTASSPQNRSNTARLSIRQPVQAERVTSVSTTVATIAAGIISEKAVKSPSQLSRKTAPSESSTGGETSRNTEKTHEEAASRCAPAAVNAPIPENTTETNTSRASQSPQTTQSLEASRVSQSPQTTQSLEARSKYLLVYKEKKNPDINQMRKPVPLRASPTSATRTLARPQQIPTGSAPDVCRGPLVSGASKRANQARKSTREARGAAAAAPLPLTLYVRARKSDDVRTTEKKPEDTVPGAEECEATRQNMKTTARRTGAMPQSAQSCLNHDTNSHSSTVRTPTTFHHQQCRSTEVDEVASATPARAAGDEVDGDNRSFAEKAEKIEAEAEKAPYAVKKGQSACDHAGAPHFGDTRTSETPDSGCSTTTAEVAPTAAGGAQDQHQLCMLKPKGTREKQTADSQAPGIPERSECLRLLAKQQDITFPEKRLTATGNFCPTSVQRPKQSCKAREKSGAVFLTPKGSSVDLKESQKREKQEKPLHHMGGELTPRKHHGREAETSQKRKCDLYVKRKEPVTQGRITSHALPQQHNVVHNSVQGGQGRKTVPWVVAVGAAGASSTAGPSGAKRTSIDTESVMSAQACRYIPSIHNETQSGERW